MRSSQGIYRRALVAPLFALALCATACGDDEGGSNADCDTSELTYANFGMSFMETYCTDCHAPGAQNHFDPDLDTQEKVQQQRDRVDVRSGTGLTMPPTSPRPSSEERADLSLWLQCGAL